jgi:hypothetical protein
MYTIFNIAVICLLCLLIYLIVKPDPPETEEVSKGYNRNSLMLSQVAEDNTWIVTTKDGKLCEVVDEGVFVLPISLNFT